MNQIVISKYSSLLVILLSTIQMPINAENITTKVFEKVSGSVVIIKAHSKKYGDFQGSGVLIEDGKTIVTNLHVVQNATMVNIEFPDGRIFRSKGYLAVNADKDLITIRLPKKISGLSAVKIANLNGLKVGQKVVAIGSPQGLSNTVSEGINSTNSTEQGAFAGVATAAVNVGAGVNIGLDQLARGFANFSGASLPEYFKLPIEFSFGYHWQVGLDDLLFESINEDLGIDDGGFTYSVGLKW